MSYLPEPLRAMASFAQFIVWEAVWDEKKQKYQKYPKCPKTHSKIDAHNTTGWMTWDQACEIAQAHKYGIGFVFTENDPFFFVDIDGALQADGTWSPFAQEICRMFPGCAVEISYSGTGLHIFGVGIAPPGHRCRDDKLGLEFYTEGRFVALTGNGIVGNSGCDGQAGVNFLLAKYLPPRSETENFDWTVEPVPEWSGPDDDDELIGKMLKAKSSAAVFGTRASLKDLWEGNAEELAKFYPSKSGDIYDRSSADVALCQHLAFWTGKDCERIQRLFERSALVRDKWHDRRDYREETIIRGCAWCGSVYKSNKKPKEIPDNLKAVPNSVNAEGVVREGFQYLGLPQQLEYFKDCVYVSAPHVIKIPNGSLLKSEQFRAIYGGYWFALDSIGDKSTRNAWEAFTESQGIVFPKVDLTCFRPELPPNHIVYEDERTLVNTYVPIKTPRKQGDPTPFLNHLRKLVPNERDRIILLSYMAACVQMIGVKFRWCPFIQGVPGNGKSKISEVVANAIGRRYSHAPMAHGMAGDFNEWVEGKLFIYVNDIYTTERQEVLEILKPLITEPFVEIHPKGRAKYMADNRANFILNSNHKDGIRKTVDDRRYAPFYTAQQARYDLQRDGMTNDYFHQLNAWLDADGYAIVANYLENYSIPAEFNPSRMSEAPITTSTNEAILSSLGGIEQDVLEAIHQGRPGFMGGWISSIALDRLIELRKDSRRMPANKRKEMLESLGYVPHPNLPDGRVSSPIAIDGGSKPRLYIKKDHLAMHLNTNAQIVDNYVKCQEMGATAISAEIFKTK